MSVEDPKKMLCPSLEDLRGRGASWLEDNNDDGSAAFYLWQCMELVIFSVNHPRRKFRGLFLERVSDNVVSPPRTQSDCV